MKVPTMIQRLLLGISLVLLAEPVLAAERDATPVSQISISPGFQMELLRSAQPGEGSWISMTFDPNGRIILGDDVSGLLRVTLGETPELTTVERLAGTEQFKHCRGVLYAHDSLYLCETNGRGIFRLKDLNGDGDFEDVQLLVPLVYQSRYGHGANQLRLGPDGMIYVAIGNDVFYPEKRSPDSPYLKTENDWLLPNPRDGAPDPRSGCVLKMSPDGSELTVLCGGLRNQVDIDFNSDGELFTWDADMEWDVGLPWYRPTRINHIVSGGEYGWRWGTGKWANWFPDALPSNLDTGLGSPTGIAFGTRSNWPNRYRDSLYAADWQHGRLLRIELTEKGASYLGTYEVFAEGTPLNICDIEFGPDGSLYFITGGRGSQSGLYRIRMTEEIPGATEELPKSKETAQARAVRRELESLHVTIAPDRVSDIWSHLGSDDPWVRFAARLALEHQPLESWRNRVQEEPDSRARHAALMALARTGQPSDQKLIFSGIGEWEDFPDDPDELLWKLRTLQLTLIRQGLPDAAQRASLLDILHRLPPSNRFSVNWLLGELLVALESPRAVEFLVGKLSSAGTQEEQVQYVKTLMQAKSGWTPHSRQAVLNWLNQNKQLPGGRLVNATLAGFREDFALSFTEEERKTFSQQLEQLALPPGDSEGSAPLVSRPFVREWTVDELMTALNSLDQTSRNPEAGRQLLSQALCLRCHQFGDRGSHVGPDLTNVGKRFDRRALLESIITPSLQIDPKYSNSIYELEDGQIISGRAALVLRDQITVEVDQLTGKTVVVPRAAILESKLSPVSPMPTGLLNHFSQEEIADLISYLQGGESP